MKKSITFLVHNLYYLGGTTRAITNSANILSKAGHRVHIISVFRGHSIPFFPLNPAIQITSLIDYTSESNSRFKNIVYNRLNHYLPRLFATKEIHSDEPGIKQFSSYVEKKLIQAIGEIDTDVLVSTRASYNLLVAKYAEKETQLIAQEHMLFTKHTVNLQKAIINEYPIFDKVTTLTKSDAKHYQQFMPREKVFVLPNSLPEELENLTIAEKEQLIISAGRFEEEKGFDLLIRAINEIKDEMNDWKVKIYGDGPEKHKLQQLIKENQLEEFVSLEPTTKKLHEKMLTSKIYVLPSRFEGFGMVLIEAMATSNAVVAFDCPVGPKEIITNEINGLLVNELDTHQLAEQLKSLINNEDKIQELAAAGLKETRKYQQQAILILWEQLIE